MKKNNNNNKKKKSIKRTAILTKKKFVYLCIEFGIAICIFIAEFFPGFQLSDLSNSNYNGFTLATGISVSYGSEGRIFNFSFFGIVAIFLAIAGIAVTTYRAFYQMNLKNDRRYQVGLLIGSGLTALLTILRKQIVIFVGFYDMDDDALSDAYLTWGSYVLFAICLIFFIIVIFEIIVDDKGNRKTSKYRRNYY